MKKSIMFLAVIMLLTLPVILLAADSTGAAVPATWNEILMNAVAAILAAVVPLIVMQINLYVKARAEEFKARAKESQNMIVRNRGVEVAEIVIRVAETIMHVDGEKKVEDYLKAVADSAKKEISDSTVELYKNLNKDLDEVIKNYALQVRDKFFRRNPTPVN